MHQMHKTPCTEELDGKMGQVKPAWQIVSCFALIGVILLAGCASQNLNRLKSEGRYSELASQVEAESGASLNLTTSKLGYLCYAYAQLKRYNKLFPCVDQLEENIKSGDVNLNADPLYVGAFFGKNTENTDISWMAPLLRAQAYVELGENAKAIAEGRRALDLAKRLVTASRVSIQIEAAGLVGLAYALTGDRASALKTAEELGVLSASYKASPIGLRGNIQQARISMGLREYQKALDYMDRTNWFPSVLADVLVLTLSLVTRTNLSPGSATANYSRTYVSLPYQFMRLKALLETGNVPEAKAGLDQLLQQPETPQNGAINWLILFDRGRIAEREDDPRAAISYYIRAIEIIESQRASINTETSKIGFVGDKQVVYGSLVGALFAEGRHGDALEYVERAKSRALVDLLAQKQDFSVPAGDPAKVKLLLAQADTRKATDGLPAILEEAAKVRNLSVTAQQELTQQAPELAALVTVSAVKLEDIKARLPADEALVSYYYTDQDLFAFVLTAQGVQATRLERRELEADVRRFRQMMDNSQSQARDVRRVTGTSESDYLGLSQQLYQRLLRPIEAQLQQRQVTIVPHGILHYLPFNALHDGTRFTIERYALRMLPSASTLRYLRADKSAKTGQILAFGNPDLGDPKFDLSFAQQEALDVTKTLPDSKALLRQDATKAAFKEFGAQFKYLHFATHGQFNADEPLASALMLARKDQEDGRLTVSDLYSLNLDADLVTMSACETGLGKIANGDDIIGLTRGFLYAGARSVVASLWKVDDKATSTLMTRFYEKLGKTDQREALRQAQLETKAAFPHPYYWAAFQITGNAN